MAIKQKKVKTLVSAMALHQARTVEAVAASPLPAEHNITIMTQENVTTLLERLTAIDIPTNQVTKLVCHDPWVSFIITIITILGVILYVYRSCRQMTFMKGHKFASICDIHIIFCNSTRYVPLKMDITLDPHSCSNIMPYPTLKAYTSRNNVYGIHCMLNGKMKESTTRKEQSL